MNSPFAVERQVMRIPWLHVIVNRVLLLAIALTDIDERVVESVMVSAFALPVKTQHHTAAVPRYIGYLVTVIGIIWIGDIDSRLVGVIESRTQHKAQRQEKRHVRFCIYSVDFHCAEVEHRPSKLLSLWIGDDLVRHPVIVIRSADIQVIDLTRLAIRQLNAVLARQLGS